MILLPLLLAFTQGSLTQGSDFDLVPRPVSIKANEYSFRLNPLIGVFVVGGDPEGDLGRMAAQAAVWLAPVDGKALRTGSMDVDPGWGRLGSDAESARHWPISAWKGMVFLEASAKGPEGSYRLEVGPVAVRLQAPDTAGLFWGLQTLRQLRRGDTIPGCVIEDEPRFPWRGQLLDVGRHFLSVDQVKKTIDLLAYHKMNVLHWHLVEDQGWRMEVKRYPRLTEVGAWREAGANAPWPGRHGGFYTQEEIREVVAYAAERHVTVVPEIEMPGHCQAALASYPELSCTGAVGAVGNRWGVVRDVYCAGSEEVFEFLTGVLEETLAMFPSEFIHIGGDECPKDRWKACPKCQARIKSEGLKDENELQSWFIKRIDAWLTERGRRLVGWDEILEGGLAKGATVQSWRGMNGALIAARAGHDVVSSPTSHCYLDYDHVAIPLAKTYSFDPVPPELTREEGAHVLGLEGNVWGEWTPTDRVEQQTWPRLCAVAEIGWSRKDARDETDFLGRMKTHYGRLDALGVRYFVPTPRCVTKGRVFTDEMSVVLDNPLGRGVIRYTLDGSEPNSESLIYEGPFTLTESTTVKARLFAPGGRSNLPVRAEGIAGPARARSVVGSDRDVVEYTFRRQALHASVREDLLYLPGIWWMLYDSGDTYWETLPDFRSLSIVASGSAETISTAVSPKGDNFGLVFYGYMRVPESGAYTASLHSDDGSRLWIGDDLVVDNDGLHAPRTRTGDVLLEQGLHPIRVEFFQAGGAVDLAVSWTGPGIGEEGVSYFHRGW